MKVLIGCAALVLSAASTILASSPTTVDPREAKARPVIDKAIAYLRSQQDKASGGWAVPPEGPVFPAISALVLNGMLMDKGADFGDETVRAGVAFVLKYRQADGGIYDRILPSYNTAICLSMLSRVDSPEARSAIKPAQEFLKSLQFGDGAMVDGQFARETGRVGQDHPFYGGVGYGRTGRPDNSNLNFFLQAMADSGLPDNDPAVRRALVFLGRTQMLDSANDLPFADGSAQGGFIYATASSKDSAGQGQSYGGEIAESLSGPPGTVASVVFSPGADGKPRTMAKTAFESRVREALALDEATKSAAADAMILLGPGDSTTSDRFEVRTSVRAPGILRAVLERAFAATGEAKVDVQIAPAWKGVSRLRAYGSMTYAGFKSLIYAKLPRNDERVKMAHEWIRRNYTLAENPGAGTDGLYYYYLTFARALDAWGEPMIEVVRADGSKESRDWAVDLIETLAGLQQDDGSFRIMDDRWMENNPVLITAYALIALEHAAN